MDRSRGRMMVRVGGALAVLVGTLALAGVGNAAPEPDSPETRAPQGAHTRLAEDLGSSDYGVRVRATEEALRRAGIAIKVGKKTVGAPIGPASVMVLSRIQVANLALQSGTDISTLTLGELGREWALTKMMVLGGRNAATVMGDYVRELVKAERRRPNAAGAFIPMFLDAMAKQRRPGTNLAGNFSPSAISINGLEEILLAVSLERFIPKRPKKPKGSKRPERQLRSFQPCSNLLNSVAWATGDNKWATKKAIQQAVEGFMEGKLSAAIGKKLNTGRKPGKMPPNRFIGLIVKRIMGFLKIVEAAFDVYKTAVLLNSTTIEAQATEASREKPQSRTDGLAEAEYTDFRGLAGVDQRVMDQYMNWGNHRALREAFSDCLNVLGLPAPFWSDSLVEDLENYRVEWELMNPAQQHYNWDAPYNGGSGGTIWAEPPEPLVGLGQLAGYSSPSGGEQAVHVAKLKIEPQEWRTGMKGLWVETQVNPDIKARLDTSEFKSEQLVEAALSIATEDPFGLGKSVIEAANNLLKRFYGPETRATMAITYRERCTDSSRSGGPAGTWTTRAGEVCTFTPPQTYSGTFRGTESETTNANYSDEIVSTSRDRNWDGFLTFSYSEACPASYVNEVDPEEYFACYDLSQASISFSETGSVATTRDGETVRCEVSGSGTIRERDLEELEDIYEGYDELVLHMSTTGFEMWEGFEYWSPYVVTESDAPAVEDALTGECRGTGIEPYDAVDSFQGLALHKEPPLQQVPIAWAPGQFVDLPNWTGDLFDLERSWQVNESDPEDTFRGNYSWSLQGSGAAPPPTNRGLTPAN